MDDQGTALRRRHDDVATPHGAQGADRRSAPTRCEVLTCLAVVLVAVAGVAAYLTSDVHARHDPYHPLQQLDALYLDEPAPGFEALGLRRGRPSVVVFCRACDAPEVDAQVRVSSDRALAGRYGLVTAEGRLGPGYAVIDAEGRVRYRTFDPVLAEHEKEIEILVEGVQ